MPKTIHYISIFVSLFIITSMAMGDAFDKTVDEIKVLETDLQQNQIDIEEKQTFIDVELASFRSNHVLNAPKGEFESDADYTARINRLNAAVTRQRNELENKHLTPLQVQRKRILFDIGSLSQRVFYTHDVIATLGRYDANNEYFPITFEANNQTVNVRLYISRHNDAPTLKENWDKVVKKAYISIDPGYQRGLWSVQLEYLPLWEFAQRWNFYQVYHFTDNHESVAFSSDGKYLATGGSNGHTIWEMDSGRRLRHKNHNAIVYGVTFSPDGQYIATGDGNSMDVWEVGNGKHIMQSTFTYVPYGTRRYAPFSDVEFSPDGQYLATAHLRGIRIFTMNLRKVSWETSRSYVPFGIRRYAGFPEVEFSPDGQYLATGDTWGDTIIWNAKTGRNLRQIGNRNAVWDVNFRPDGQYLVTGDDGGNVSIIEVSSGTKLHVLRHSGGWIGDVVFSPDGKYLAVGRENSRITFYKIPQGKLDIDSKINFVKTIYTGGSVYELAWHPGGNFISDGKKVYRTLLQTKIVNLTPPTIYFPEIEPVNAGTTFTLDFKIKDVPDLSGWQLEVAYNPDVVSVAEVKEGDFLKAGNGNTFFQGGSIENTTGKVTGLSSVIVGGDGISGAGALLSLTFDAKSAGDAEIQLLNTQLSNSSGEAITHEIEINPITIVEGFLPEDVNQDKVVNIQDLVLVASSFGQTGENNADVNDDGIVNIQDLVLVASAFGNSASAPSIFSQELTLLSATEVQKWLSEAQQLNRTDPRLQQGIHNLEQILTALTPKETTLLPNYPNPFNPETWIPYQLATPTDVTISIYSADGKLIRRLDLGHKPVGIYQHRSNAAHWDGKNMVGEPVASGVYFYTFTAGDFSATRKMLIRK